MNTESWVLRKTLAVSTDDATTTGKEGAELHAHQRAVPLRQRVEGAVRERAEEVEVADDRPRLGARQTVARPAPASGGGSEEHDRGDHHGKDGRPPPPCWWLHAGRTW